MRGRELFDGALLRLVLQHLPGSQNRMLKFLLNTMQPGAVIIGLDVDESCPDIMQPVFPKV
jgi:hypothetical protein